MLKKEAPHGWNQRTGMLLADSAMKHSPHTPEYGIVQSTFELVAKDLNKTEEFKESAVTGPRVQQKFDRLVKHFKVKYEGQGSNLSGNEWTDVERLLLKVKIWKRWRLRRNEKKM